MQGFDKIAVIGFGAVADEIIRSLQSRRELGRLTGILVRPTRIESLRHKTPDDVPLVGDLASLLAARPDIVIEAAGHAAARAYGLDVLRAGSDLLLAAVGVLADPIFLNAAEEACGKARNLWIAAGAVAGLDALLAARTLGIETVKYTSVKPPEAWIGTPGEAAVRTTSDRRIAFFKGTARQAASQYPQNANVAATIAFGGIGLDRTQVELVSDPTAPGPVGLIEAHGAFGRLSVEILALASANNPKSSALTGHSLASAVLDGMRFSPFDFRAEH